MPKTVSSIMKIDAGRIVDWPSFHEVFAETLGFQGLYGRNINAWIDCLSCLNEPEAGVTNVHAPPGGGRDLCRSTMSLASQLAVQQALVECAELGNWRWVAKGEPS